MVASAQTVGSIDEEIAAEISATTPVSDCAACARDYSSPCPKSWISESGMCVAPESYAGQRLPRAASARVRATGAGAEWVAPARQCSGPCPGSAYFSAMSTSDKQSYEKRCSACWPCGAAAA